MTIPQREVASLLFAPLPELNPPGFDLNQLNGLRSLPAVGSELKLIYGLRALQPLAEHGADAIAAALTLVTEILSAFGAFL
ncbi:MAG: hypothetical protein GY856_19870, partial [bacterium]|nr:hypothetical protein [bacterium]